MEFIRRLRSKPEAHRRKVLIISSVGLTLIIFLIWLSVTTSKLASLGEGDVPLERDEIDSPLASFRETFGGFFDDFKAGLESLRN